MMSKSRISNWIGEVNEDEVIKVTKYIYLYKSPDGVSFDKFINLFVLYGSVLLSRVGTYEEMN